MQITSENNVILCTACHWLGIISSVKEINRMGEREALYNLVYADDTQRINQYIDMSWLGDEHRGKTER